MLDIETKLIINFIFIEIIIHEIKNLIIACYISRKHLRKLCNIQNFLPHIAYLT